MILVSRTYDVVTEESAQDGEAAERGFDWQDIEYSFTELVHLMRDHPNASNSRPLGTSFEWCSSDPEQDYTDGSYTTYSIHYSSANKPRSAKYWRWAMIAAGIAKR